jgi:hypothetical protein
MLQVAIRRPLTPSAAHANDLLPADFATLAPAHYKGRRQVRLFTLAFIPYGLSPCKLLNLNII